MKFAVVILACVAAASAQFNNNPYNPFGNQNQFQRYRPTPKPYNPFPAVTIAPTYAPVFKASTPAPVPRPAVKVAVADARNAQIVKYGNDVNPDGSYAYYYETDNGIAAQEQGTPRVFAGNPPVAPVVAQGSYRYYSPEGQLIDINYVADENGFQPSGAAIPTPPPVPAQIARALEYIARYAPQK